MNNDSANDNVTYTSYRSFYNKKGTKKTEYSYQEGDDLVQSYELENSKKLIEYSIDFGDYKKGDYLIQFTNLKNGKVIQNDNGTLKSKNSEDEEFEEITKRKQLRKATKKMKKVFKKIPKYMRKNFK